MTRPKLDRMVLDEAGLNPQRLAEAIHEQIGGSTSPLPVHEIALALDIAEVREAPLTTFEGALVTTPERDRGAILLNARSNPQRRRYTLGHELLHFLNPTHRPLSPAEFQCSRGDMLVRGDHRDRHQRQEAEANSFSIELLTPRNRLRPFLTAPVDVRRGLEIVDEFDISRKAAARRYAELHDEPIVVIFCRDGWVECSVPSKICPPLGLARGATLPDLPPERSAGLSPRDLAPADDWLSAGSKGVVSVQTLHQQNGRATVLVHAEESEDEEPGVEDAFERFTSRGV